MLLPPPAAVGPTVIVSRGGRQLSLDPSTLAAALQHLSPRAMTPADCAAQAAGDARLLVAGVLSEGSLVPSSAQLLGPVARPAVALSVEAFGNGTTTSFQIWQDRTAATMAERTSAGVLALEPVPMADLATTMTELVMLQAPISPPPGVEPVRVDRRLWHRFLTRLAAGDTPSAGGLLAGQPVSLQALRVLLALADGRARWWEATSTSSEEHSPMSSKEDIEVVDAGREGLWCSRPGDDPGATELVLVPATPDQVLCRCRRLCAAPEGISSAA